MDSEDNKDKGGESDGASGSEENLSKTLEDIFDGVETEEDVDPDYRFSLGDLNISPIAFSKDEEEGEVEEGEVEEGEVEEGEVEEDDGEVMHVHEEPDYSSNIGNREAVSGDIHHMDFNIQNICDQTFPGGKLVRVKIRDMGGSDMQYPGTEVEIPELEPEETYTVNIHLSLTQSGSLTFVSDIEADDGGKVVFNTVGTTEEEEIYYGFRSIEREKLQMVQSLNRIEEELTNGRD